MRYGIMDKLIHLSCVAELGETACENFSHGNITTSDNIRQLESDVTASNNSITSSNAITTNSASISSTSSNNSNLIFSLDESILQSNLEAISKSQSVILPKSLFGLRTRPARRVSVFSDPNTSGLSSNNNHGSSNPSTSSSTVKSQYSVSFGGVGRSRLPSKKNIVLEIADARYGSFNNFIKYTNIKYFLFRGK